MNYTMKMKIYLKQLKDMDFIVIVNKTDLPQKIDLEQC